MKIILCGYHWTGCKALELLLEEEHEVYVYTHETENCVADLEGLCIRKNIGYSLEKIQVNNLPFVPDVICSIYYRYLIKQDVIDAVNGRIFNLHPALLPQYRGCSSLTWAMINGEEECGFTFHYIDAGCDTGNIILQKRIKIEDFDTQLTLYNRVMFESMRYFIEALHLVQQGYEGKVQEGTPTKYARGCPMEGIITDSMDEKMKERFIRAMCYPPYPAAQYKDQEIRTFRDLKKIFEGGGRMIIFGCGGHARSIINTLHRYALNAEIALIDKNATMDELVLDCKVIQRYELREKDGYIIAIGDNSRRRELFDYLLKQNRGKCIAVISRDSNIGLDAQIGTGTFIAPFAYIGPEARIGDNAIINSGSIIEHEVIVGNHTHIAPSATICGRTRIGDNVFCGAGSTIIDKLTICDNVIIGAGAVVKEDIVMPGTYVGVPARKIS